MSSLLRSSKFLRCFAGTARSSILNTRKSQDVSFTNATKTLYSLNTEFRDYSTLKVSDKLDPKLARLDLDVRRTGRISRRDIDDILEVIRNKYAISSSQSLLIIRCCGELVPEELPTERMQLVQKIWSILEERGVPFDISHYNALLRVYIENEHKFSPAEFLDELEKKGIQPNRVTYQRLMWSYCQSGNIEGATQVLERMRELGLPVSEPVLNALVMGHSLHGDVAGARSVLETMAAAGLQPSERTYTLLASGLAKQGDIEGIKQLLSDCTEKDIILGDRDLMEILEVLAVSGHSEAVDQILNVMHKGPGYNQDAINLIYKLLNQEQDETAIKVFQSLTPNPLQGEGNQHLFQGAFFVKHLVKVGTVERIIGLCRRVQTSGLAPKALLIAGEEALSRKMTEKAFAILKEMNIQGLPVRPHYFWPILNHFGNSGKKNELMSTIKMMTEDFGTLITGETARDYIVPHLDLKNINKDLRSIVDAGVKPLIAAQSIAYNLLLKQDLKGAAEIANTVYISGQIDLLTRPLAISLQKTGDVDSYVKFTHVICDAQGRLNKLDESESNSEKYNDVIRDRIGKVLYFTVELIASKKDLVNRLFIGLLEDGLSITGSWASKIQDKLGSDLSAEIVENLARLTSRELEPVQLKQLSTQWTMSPERLKKLISEADEKNANTGFLKRQLITAYIRNNDKEQLIKYLDKLETEQYVLTSGTMAILINFFAQIDDLQSAIKYKDALFEKEPDFILDSVKALRLALAMIKADKCDDALDFLKKVHLEESLNESFIINSITWTILNHLAEKGDAAMVENITKIFLDKKIVPVSNSVFGASIKVHLVQDNLDAALDVFETCCTKYRCTPWKAELTRRLIQKEDAARLQRLTDLSTTVHGEINSLYDLVFAFVECGRLKQARKILETPGLWSRPTKLSIACEKYEQEGKIEHLEGLMEATKELTHIDRSDLYYHLLSGYCKEDNPNKALELWTTLQEEDVPPTDKFLSHLASYLRSKNIEVPFVVPKLESTVDTPPKEIPANDTSAPPASRPMSSLRSAILSHNFDLALSLSTDHKRATNADKSLLIGKLVENDRIDDAVKQLMAMLEAGQAPLDRPLRWLINKLTENGNLADLQRIEKHLSTKQKASLSIENKICQVVFESGQANQYLTELEEELQRTSREEDFLRLNHKYPRPQSLKFISGDEVLFAKCVELAHKFADGGVAIPANCLWIYYFSNGLTEEADAIWNKYLLHRDRSINFRHILGEAYSSGNADIIIRLLSTLKQNKLVNAKALGICYSRLIDLYIHQNEYAKAESALKEASADGVTVDNINANSVARLKNALNEKGKSLSSESN